MPKPARPLVLPSLALAAALLAATPAGASDKVFHLAVGDPARKDRVAPVALDGITDTRKGEIITAPELAARLGATRLLLLGEEHTSVEFHAVQLRVLAALVASGRHVLIGLEMFPYTAQRALDLWRDPNVPEERFLRESHWYDHWGYNWLYYREIFQFAREHRIPMFAVNTPREVVAAVRRKGLANLTPEEAAHIPARIDVDNADHLTFFKATFEDQSGPIHGGGMGEEMWRNMLSAQCTWDATMGFNAVQALRRANDPAAIMAVLVGSGHVAYGLGIERQARQWFDGPIATLIPVRVGSPGRRLPADTQASYADFTWGVPEEIDGAYPMLGISTVVGAGAAGLQVIDVQDDTPGARAGIRTGDVLLALDGVALADKETFNRLMAARRWGDSAVIAVRRGTAEIQVPVALRRSLSAR
jgi:uncharacterized iron-regulated protein